tara:strand:+ start:85 stop:513 length:429 start_codon:yes stop_codon:yes gene_type:complete
MSIKLSEIRQGIATQILTLSGYNQSKFPVQYFARQENTLAHKSFSVGISITEESGERQRRATYYLSSVIEVKIAYRLRPLDIYPTDYDNALDAEEDIIKKILSSYQSINDNIQIRFLRSNRDIPDSMEYLISTLEFQTLNTI